MELIHSFHTGLVTIGSFLKIALESISIFSVLMGLVTSLIMAAGFGRRPGQFLQNIPAVRLQFGSWLGLALEFQLGADIVATTLNPSLQSLGELAILAAIRTFLNFFLQKELAAEAHRGAKIRSPRQPPMGEGLKNFERAKRERDYP
jgi:uncharacterized membrane protein